MSFAELSDFTPNQAFLQPSSWFCPECQIKEMDRLLSRDSEGYRCRHCGNSWSEEELGYAYGNLLTFLAEKYDEACTERDDALQECADLKATLGQIGSMVDGVAP